MALGSSAPEIILNVIEIIGSGFVAGDLGPGKNSKNLIDENMLALFCHITSLSSGTDGGHR